MSYLNEHRNEILKKYPKSELIRDVNNYVNGSGINYNIYGQMTFSV